MKIIREHIEFKQGGNPYQKMGLGFYPIGTKFKILINLFFDHKLRKYQNKSSMGTFPIIRKGEKFIIKKIVRTTNIDNIIKIPYYLMEFKDNEYCSINIKWFAEHIKYFKIL